MQADVDEPIAREAAVERVIDLRAAVIGDLPIEDVGLEEVGGRVLAGPIEAPADNPPFDYATMDGFAFDATDPYPLELTDREVFPEDEPPPLGPGEAVRIATGAPLPEGANAVLKREDAAVEDGRLRGAPIEPGTYTYERASNVAAGETLFEAGERLGPRDAILLRDLGAEPVAVRRRLSVGVLATGTEIHEGRQADLDSPMLCGLVRAWGHRATFAGSVPDDASAVADTITELASAHDVVVTTGGTSVGRKDHVVRTLHDLGEVLFHRVAVRPGKPLAVARLPAHDAVAFAIPGKPVGAHTVATLVARPFFTGQDTLPTVGATLAADVGIGDPTFEYAVPVTLAEGGAMPLGHVDSPLRVYDDVFDPSVLSSSTRATRADGFVLTRDDVAAGETVRVVPYDALE